MAVHLSLSAHPSTTAATISVIAVRARVHIAAIPAATRAILRVSILSLSLSRSCAAIFPELPLFIVVRRAEVLEPGWFRVRLALKPRTVSRFARIAPLIGVHRQQRLQQRKARLVQIEHFALEHGRQALPQLPRLRLGLFAQI